MMRLGLLVWLLGLLRNGSIGSVHNSYYTKFTDTREKNNWLISVEYFEIGGLNLNSETILMIAAGMQQSKKPFMDYNVENMILTNNKLIHDLDRILLLMIFGFFLLEDADEPAWISTLYYAFSHLTLFLSYYIISEDVFLVYYSRTDSIISKFMSNPRHLDKT